MTIGADKLHARDLRVRARRGPHCAGAWMLAPLATLVAVAAGATACSTADETGIVARPTESWTSSEPGGSGSGGDAGPGGSAAGAAGATGGTTATGGGGAGGAPGPCPSDMVQIADSCMDRYEAPNEPGVPPLAMQNAPDGEQWCAARGKRLCLDVEWVRACEGVAGTTYPYGDEHVAHRCNDDKTWLAPDWGLLAQWPSDDALAEAERLYQGDPSGARSDCRSEDGAFDLTGNVAEWVVRTIPNANDYDHVMKGCYWAGCYGGTLPNCSFVNPAHPSEFRSYESGFRCCRDALP